MTVSYSLAPEPFWYIVNDAGTAAGGAKMYTKKSSNPTVDKIVYQDAGGTTPWTNPIIFDLNGVQGPFYWEFDSDFPEELYYIRVTDADDNLIWDIDNFSGDDGSGGGGTVTTYLPLSNYIANNQFIDNVGTTTTTSLTNLVIAPSNHKGFTPALVNPITAAYGVVGPDIRFVKNSTANTDEISFPEFDLDDEALSPDVTPVCYVRYRCTTDNTGESYKNFQFPITQKVKNLANQTMSFRIWAATTSGTATLTASVIQYFGSGTSASTEARDVIDTLSLTTTWTPFTFDFVVPDLTGKSLGTSGQQTDDDALYIHLEMPLNTICDVKFTKPALYLGAIDPDKEFDTYDQINSIDSTPRTGDIKTSLLSSAPMGWIAMNDGTIGEVGSGADTAGAYTFQLYKTIWDGVFSNTWAPILTSAGASSTYGSSAVDDFVALKRLTLPRSLGRALAGAGTGSGLTARVLGEYVGSEVITLDGMPSHTHGPGAGTGYVNTITSGSGGSVNTGTLLTSSANTAATGGGTLNVQGGTDGNMEPTSFFNVFIKL